MDFIQAHHAAVASVLSMAAREFLRVCREHDPDVVSLRVESSSAQDGTDLEFELIGRTGHAIGGGVL